MRDDKIIFFDLAGVFEVFRHSVTCRIDIVNDFIVESYHSKRADMIQ